LETFTVNKNVGRVVFLLLILAATAPLS